MVKGREQQPLTGELVIPDYNRFCEETERATIEALGPDETVSQASIDYLQALIKSNPRYAAQYEIDRSGTQYWDGATE